MAQPSDTVSLRITLRYKDLDEFAKRYAENVSSAGLFLRTRAPKATGTKIRFELLLADGTRALRGEGVVVTIREGDKPGMAMRFSVLDAESRAVVDRIVNEHGDGSLAPTPLATTFGAKPAEPSAPEPTSGGTGWRPMKTGRSGWVPMGGAAKPLPRSGSSIGPGRVLPRRPSRSFGSSVQGPPKADPLPKRGPVLPRQASSLPRPWATPRSTPAEQDTDERTQRLPLDALSPAAAEPTTQPDPAPPLSSHPSEADAAPDEAPSPSPAAEPAKPDAAPRAPEIQARVDPWASAIPGDIAEGSMPPPAAIQIGPEHGEAPAQEDLPALSAEAPSSAPPETEAQTPGADEPEAPTVDEAAHVDAASDEAAPLTGDEATAEDTTDEPAQDDAAADIEPEAEAAHADAPATLDDGTPEQEAEPAEAEAPATVDEAVAEAAAPTSIDEAPVEESTPEHDAPAAQSVGQDDGTAEHDTEAVAEEEAPATVDEAAAQEPAPPTVDEAAAEEAAASTVDEAAQADAPTDLDDGPPEQQAPATVDEAAPTLGDEPATTQVAPSQEAALPQPEAATGGDDVPTTAGADAPGSDDIVPAASQDEPVNEAAPQLEDDQPPHDDAVAANEDVAAQAPEGDAQASEPADSELEPAAPTTIDDAVDSSAVLGADEAWLDAPTTALPLDQLGPAALPSSSRVPLPRAMSSSWGDEFQVAAELTDQLSALSPLDSGEYTAQPRQDTVLDSNKPSDIPVPEPAAESEPLFATPAKPWLDEQTQLDAAPSEQRLKALREELAATAIDPAEPSSPSNVGEAKIDSDAFEVSPLTPAHISQVAAIVVDTASAVANGLPEPEDTPEAEDRDPPQDAPTPDQPAPQDSLPLLREASDDTAMVKAGSPEAEPEPQAQSSDDLDVDVEVGPVSSDFDAALESIISAASAQTTAMPPDGLPTVLGTDIESPLSSPEAPSPYNEMSGPLMGGSAQTAASDPSIAPQADAGPRTQVMESPDFLDEISASLGMPPATPDTPWPDVNDSLRLPQYRSPTQSGTESEAPSDVNALMEEAAAEALASEPPIPTSTSKGDEEPQPAQADAPQPETNDSAALPVTTSVEAHDAVVAPPPEDDAPSSAEAESPAEPEPAEDPAEPAEDPAEPAEDSAEPVEHPAEPAEVSEADGAAAQEPDPVEPVGPAEEPESEQEASAEETLPSEEPEPEASAPAPAPEPTPQEALHESETRVAEPTAESPEAPEAPAVPEPVLRAAMDDAETRLIGANAPAATPAQPLDEAETRHADEMDAPTASEDKPVKAYEEAATEAAIIQTGPRMGGSASLSIKAPTDEPVPVRLDTATEVVKAYDSVPPEPSAEQAPTYSTKVQVTGVDSQPPTEAQPEATQRMPRDQAPQDMLRKARAAAFSEEATEVPPERDLSTQQVRTRAPVAERRATADIVRPRPGRVVGVELGRHWARVAIMEHGDLELIGASGSPYVPSVVAVRSDGTLVAGLKAQAIHEAHPERAVRPMVVLNAWRDDEIPESAAKVSSWKNGEPVVQIGDHSFAFSEVLTTLLRVIQSAIHSQLSTQDFKVMLGVPNELAPQARRTLQNACRDAELSVARLLTEPQAMLQAYNMAERAAETVLMVDVGVSHLGLAVARRNKGHFDIVGHKQVSDPCARSLDECVADMTLEQLASKANEDHSQDPGARRRLIQAVEHARPELGRVAHLDIKVQLPAPGGAAGVAVERAIRLPRSRVYQVTEPLVMEICQQVQELLRDCQVDPKAVQAVLLAGSAGHFPPLVQALHALTQQEPLVVYPGPQVVVVGLAKSGQAAERAASTSAGDVLQASVGISLPGGRFGALLRAGAKLPARIERHVPTTRDNQSEVELRILQGDAEFSKSCSPLGHLALTNIPKGLRGEVRIDLEITVAKDGVLTATLSEPTTGAAQRLVAATAQANDERRAQLLKVPAVTSRAGRPRPKEKKGFFGRLFGRK